MIIHFPLPLNFSWLDGPEKPVRILTTSAKNSPPMSGPSKFSLMQMPMLRDMIEPVYRFAGIHPQTGWSQRAEQQSFAIAKSAPAD
jgi:hypothetical protein